MIANTQIREIIQGILPSLGVTCVLSKGSNQRFTFQAINGKINRASSDAFGTGDVHEVRRIVFEDSGEITPCVGDAIDVANVPACVVSVMQNPAGGNWTLGLSDSFSTRATVSTRARVVRNTAAAPAGSAFSVFLIWNDGDLIAPQSDAWIASGDSEAVLHVRKHDWPGDSAPDREMIFTRDDGVSVTASNVVRTTYGWRISAKFRRGE